MHGLHKITTPYQGEAHSTRIMQWLHELGYSHDYVMNVNLDGTGTKEVWRFECSKEATHFKLTWGGTGGTTT